MRAVTNSMLEKNPSNISKLIKIALGGDRK